MNVYFDCGFKKGSTNPKTLKQELPEACKAKGCSGGPFTRWPECESFIPVTKVKDYGKEKDNRRKG